MADLATIQKIRDQLIINGSGEGWRWETDDFCGEAYLPSRESAMADFNYFVTSGELEAAMADFNQFVTAALLLEGGEPEKPDPDLF